jgi:2-dehydropantoate 2-reductase
MDNSHLFTTMSEHPVEILLFGAGAVGSVYAYILKQSDAKVSICARSNYEVAKNSGLTFESEKFGLLKGVKFDRGASYGSLSLDMEILILFS